MGSPNAPYATSRRSALKTIAVGAALTGLAGAVAFVRGRGYVADRGQRPALTSLRAWESVVVASAASRIAAPDRPDDRSIPSVEEVDVVGFIDSYVARMPLPLRRDLSRALLYLEQVAPLVAGYSSRFSDLSPAAQDRVLAALEISPVVLLRGAFAGVKSLVFMGYYRDARTWALLGYGGPWLTRKGRGGAMEEP